MEELREKLLTIHERIEELKEARFLAENSTLTESQYSTGDTAWILISTVLVLGMTLPGIMLYYAGMVRLGNALSTAMQGFGLAALITFLWLCFGYSLAFGPASGDDINAVIFGDASRFWLHGVYTTGSTHVLAPTIPESVFCSFQLAFAIITPCLICGAFADRMKYNAVLLSLGLWHLVVYCPIAHSNWHPNGFLNEAGVLDFAGGNVVHISAGVSALVSALIVGNRTGFGKTVFQAHNLMLSLVGACSLIVGWYGFNAGSAYGANHLAGFAILNTQISCSLASLSWTFCDYFERGKPTVDGVMNGFLAGLVGITPAAGFVTPSGAFVIGIVTGASCFAGVKIKNSLDIDDSLDAFGIHAIGGIVGGLLTGLLANSVVGGQDGAFHGSGRQFGIQIYGIVVSAGWSVVGTALVMLFVDKLIGLRVDKQSELVGLDQAEHDTTMTAQASTAPKVSSSRIELLEEVILVSDKRGNDVLRSDEMQNAHGRLPTFETVFGFRTSLSGKITIFSTEWPQSNEHAQISSGRWSDEEHALFLELLVKNSKYGRDWEKIALEFPTRTKIQVRTHADKCLYDKIGVRSLRGHNSSGDDEYSEYEEEEGAEEEESSCQCNNKE